ncbi:hypothetical protein SDC9_200099 [bioreactor metagenome]|uniref:Uncharacterized protein n=1 Tax=bioreactor metagenome TaxID=1076179 RepID=A0A645IMB7_9ZZZZ
MHAVTLEVVIRAGRAVDWDFVEVRSAKTANLRIGIGEQTPLQQGIVREINAGNDMAGMKGDLFVFGEEIIGVAVEYHFTDALHRNQRFGDQFGRIQ